MTIITDPATYSVETRRNLATNPRFGGVTGSEVSIPGGGTAPAIMRLGGGGMMNNGGGAVNYQTTLAGRTACAVDASNSTSNATSVYPAGSIASDAGDAMARIGLEVGKTYTISATLTILQPLSGTEDPTYARRIDVMRRVNGSNDAGFSLSTQAPNVPGAYRLATTFSVPAGTQDIMFRLLLGHRAGFGIWSDLLIEEGSTHGTYFDGATIPDVPWKQYAWTGTADESASVEQEPVDADRVDPAMILGPWRVSRETRRVRHQLLDSPESRYTIRPADLAGGVLEMLFTSYADAAGALSKFDRDTVWRMFEQIGTDPTPVDLLFTVDEGQMEIEQSGDSRAPFLVRIPWKEG